MPSNAHYDPQACARYSLSERRYWYWHTLQVETLAYAIALEQHTSANVIRHMAAQSETCDQVEMLRWVEHVRSN
jgi:hypothetical protein